ncbi:MAG TPA: galactitol-1-phosphate 5-dehydrogenase [Verrucomicrobiales bacterium]|nr:galactitol-1-phosphate 5-dehydrogenase [Verrucomicrobiales bacterium]
MKALQLIAPSTFEYIDAPEPLLQDPGDVIVDVRACGICGSDVHGMDGGSGRRVPPIIMGHEAAGVIHETGPEAGSWKVGDRVTFDSTVYCGACDFCRKGDINLCENRRVLGVSCEEYRQHGAFAERLRLPSRILYPLPEGMSFRHGAFAEPVSIALHAVGRLPVQPGDSAVVVGAGLIGILVIQALKLAGCGRVFAVDLDRHRLNLACLLGAEEGFHAGDPQLVSLVLERTGDQGADIAMEVVGNSPALQTAVAAVRRGGSVGLVGNLAAKTDFPLQSVVTREISLFGSCGCAGEYPEAIRLIASGAIQVEPLISAAAPLQQGADWFHRLHRGQEGLMKVLLEP